MATCHACPPGHNHIDQADMLDHARTAHPKLWDGIDTWPDGGLVKVVVDPEPADFKAPA